MAALVDRQLADEFEGTSCVGHELPGNHVQHCTDRREAAWDDRPGGECLPIHVMLFAVATVACVCAVVIVHKAHLAFDVGTRHLGSMSAEWLAQYRAAHPS
jgi:hypothetical protein